MNKKSETFLVIITFEHLSLAVSFNWRERRSTKQKSALATFVFYGAKAQLVFVVLS